MKDFLEKLESIGKTYYTIADLMKVTGLSRHSLYVLLSRYVRKKAIVRLTSGVYILPKEYGKLDVIANALYTPSYLSFESALSRYGIVSQVPYTLTFATTRKSLRRTLAATQVEYRFLQSALFFGYEKVGDLLVATPEKAVVDTLYFTSFGKAMVSAASFDLKEISPREALRIAKRYPPRTRKLVDAILRQR